MPHVHFYAQPQYEVPPIGAKKPVPRTGPVLNEETGGADQSSLLRETPPRIMSTWSKLPSEATKAAT